MSGSEWNSWRPRLIGSWPGCQSRETPQPMGLLHGGASVVLAESLGSIGAFLHAKTVWPDGVPSAVGIEINATHHRSARSGSVIGVATPVHLGRTLATFQVSISQAETGKLLCTCRITCLLRPAAAAES